MGKKQRGMQYYITDYSSILLQPSYGVPKWGGDILGDSWSQKLGVHPQMTLRVQTLSENPTIDPNPQLIEFIVPFTPLVIVMEIDLQYQKYKCINSFEHNFISFYVEL